MKGAFATATPESPPVERDIAFDMVRRALPVAPLLIGACAAGWGWDGGVSCAYAIALVLVNFALSATILSGAARISLGALMGAALFGYLFRLGLITAAVLLVRNQQWFSAVPLGLTIVVTHLGLLFWETRYVSASLAYPGLKPRAASARAPRRKVAE